MIWKKQWSLPYKKERGKRKEEDLFFLLLEDLERGEEWKKIKRNNLWHWRADLPVSFFFSFSSFYSYSCLMIFFFLFDILLLIMNYRVHHFTIIWHVNFIICIFFNTEHSTFHSILNFLFFIFKYWAFCVNFFLNIGYPFCPVLISF